MERVTVVDSIMGSGKTTWSIGYINSHTGENIMYITPFLEEIRRVREKCPERQILEPEARGKTKSDNLIELLSFGADIASTHALFKRIDDAAKDYIHGWQYTLILDEVLEVVSPYDNNFTMGDVKILEDSGCVTIDDNGFLIWKHDVEDLKTRYNDVRILCKNRSLVIIDNKVFLWQFPSDVFMLFNKVYILTYMFESSILKSYFDLYGIQYEKKSINEKCELCGYYAPDTSRYKELISIYDGKMNENISTKPNALSSSWLNSPYNKEDIEQLKKNCANYFIHITKSKSCDIMWTTLKKAKAKISGKGYTNGFISCNARSTNEFRDRYNLAYVLNLYMNPEIAKFFTSRGIKVNEDGYSLSEFLQWIWRSRIRDGQPINIYIPSRRMRSLLLAWLG